MKKTRIMGVTPESGRTIEIFEGDEPRDHYLTRARHSGLEIKRKVDNATWYSWWDAPGTGWRYADRPLEKTINQIMHDHGEWVESVGWRNTKTPLECLALIASEVGEAANECRDTKPTEKLGDELADIILRTLDMALEQDIDINDAIMEKMAKNQLRGTKGRKK